MQQSVLMLQAKIGLMMLIGIRRGDMHRLRTSEITEGGITVRPHKTANSSRLVRTFEWTPALRPAVDMALAARPIDRLCRALDRFLQLHYVPGDFYSDARALESIG
jgi:integrase